MRTKDYLLLLETATTNCSVAISLNGQIVQHVEKADEKYSHSDYLHRFIVEAMEAASIPFSKLAGVVVSKRPGSYTGLRIGVATAKGICYAHDIPLLAINTLDVLAQSYSPKEGDILVPMIDARRMEVFTKVLDHQYVTLRPTTAEIITEGFLENMPKGRKIIFGTGAEKCKPLLQGDNVHFLDDVVLPSAKHMVDLATKKFKQDSFENVAYFEPYYLKEFYSNTAKLSQI